MLRHIVAGIAVLVSLLLLAIASAFAKATADKPAFAKATADKPAFAKATADKPAFGLRASGGTQEKSGLQRLLDAELARFPGRAGVWVKHLTTGEEAGVRADETFNSASVIKIPVLVLAYQMAEKGQLSLAERITIRREDVRGGSGIFRHHDAGLQPTLRDVLLQMVITSDNTATDLAIAKVGGVARVNEWLKEHGFADGLELTQTTGELFAKYEKLPQGAGRNEKTNTDRAYWLGEMTPRATGRMLEGLQKCSGGALLSAVASAKAEAPPYAAQKGCDDMIRMMRAQQAGSRRLPHFITVPVAHKTGDFPPVLANDVGIVFARSGPIVVSFFANAIVGPYAEAEDRIGQIGRLIVEYFDGVR
jgi:beta-lactamase class A